jgi:hypothetical protein
MSGKNPAAPAFIPTSSDDLEDEVLLIPRPQRFTSGGSGSSTPITRSATPKRPRTTTSPPPPPEPPIDWALEYTKYMAAQGAEGSRLYQFKHTAFGVMMAKLEKRHTDSISALVETVKFLLGELTTIKSQVAALDSVVDIVTPAPPAFAPAPARPRPAAPAAPAPRPVPPPPPPPPPPAAPSWATVTKRGRKKKATTTHTAAGEVDAFHHRPPPETYPQYLARLARTSDPAPKSPSPSKRHSTNTTPPVRPRRLIVKRDGSELSSTPVQLRDALNKALGFTAALSTQVSRGASGSNTGHVSITLMENLLASKLYARVGEHLNTIPGAISLHLDTPLVQMVVHGVPTDLDLESLQQELTTYNPGLIMASTPRWLTKHEQRKEKKASSVVITLTGNKAQDVASRPRLFAFSSTLRAERKLRFGPSTQCGKCQQFGHHTIKCTFPPACRWCAGSHLTGAHSCPTSTCSTNGRPCTHTLAKCANCSAPHEAHFKECTSRVSLVSGEDMDVNA